MRRSRGKKRTDLKAATIGRPSMPTIAHGYAAPTGSSSRTLLFLPIAIAAALPLFLNFGILPKLWLGVRPRAWDGIGHYAVARLYDQSILPNTFGWTHAYFGGMPFPNFYPPLFYWLVSVLSHAHVISFAGAFKLVVALPVLLIPGAIWLLAWTVSGEDRAVATCSALAIAPVLTDTHFNLLGLSYESTFVTGLYTQPLGFILLVAAYIAYLRSARSHGWFACLLLALTVLANFFSAITVAVLICPVLIHDLARYLRADREAKPEERRRLLGHSISPAVAVVLTLFWTSPLLSNYGYVVTRLWSEPLAEMMPLATCAWCVVALAGALIWLRRKNGSAQPYLTSCLALAGGILFAATISPRWFPLQAPRFLATLTLLLAPAVGQTAAAAVRRLATALGEFQAVKARGRKHPGNGGWIRDLVPAPITTAIVAGVSLVVWLALKTPSYDWAFYQSADREPIDDILGFAQQHRDGRYLVEVPWASALDAAQDGRALNSYLGVQGNEALSVVFREASPNSIFFNAVANSFTTYPDNIGISSVLADDLDFAGQSTARHLDRARFIGVKYLVIFSPSIKEKLARERGIKASYDFNEWTIFELAEAATPAARPLEFRPALVVSNFSLKARRSNEYDFVRLAEEQFSDDWFDVLLIRSPTSKIDELQGLDEFGALVIDTYDCTSETKAVELLRGFSQTHPLILLSSQAALFKRIQAERESFPRAHFVDRPAEPPGEWLEAKSPTRSYGNNSVRRTWKEIRAILEREKIPTGAKATELETDVRQTSISITPPSASAAEALPILIQTTYFPDWRREDGLPIYTATPFYMLTFVSGPVEIIYARTWLDWAALFVSAGAFALLLFAIGWTYRSQLKRSLRVCLGKRSPVSRGSHGC
jgi:hypothetical protein